MLEDRFRLVIRRETKESPVYALVVAKNGARLKESTTVGGVRQGFGELTGSGATTEILATVLGMIVGRPVLDRTNLTARYDFTLKFAPQRSAVLRAEQGAAIQGAKIEGGGAADD